MRNYIEKFIVLFNRLKSELNNSLKNLKWLPNEKPEIVELCFQLDETYRNLNRIFADQPTKYSYVPNVFQKRWDEYIKYYQEKVGEKAKPLKDKYEREFREVIKQAIEDAKVKGQSPEEFVKEFIDTSPLTIGATFNPVEDDAAALLKEIFDAIHDIVASDGFPEIFTDKQMGALNYFKKVIGINFHDINRRWGNSPNLFISEKIKKKTDKLVALYNEAVKSYIFGLNVSSTAMCRALLEHILINYYGIPKDDLVKVVSLAEERFKKLKSLKLHKLRKDGNDVMHEYETKSTIEDTAVVSYLLTIKALVDLIPE
jgi:hypothetical protein